MRTVNEVSLEQRPMTPNDVLAVLNEALLACGHGAPGSALCPLTANTKIIALLSWSNGFSSFAGLIRWLSGVFEIEMPHAFWNSALRPFRERTLWELCIQISRHAKAPTFAPVCVLGHRSAAAGAFLTVRRLISSYGVDVSDLAPSSPVAPYFSKCGNRVIPALHRMAPGQVPRFVAAEPVFASFSLVRSILGLPIILAALTGHRRILVCGAIAAVACFLGQCLAAWVFRPRIYAAAARTFRDLSLILAGNRTKDHPGFPVKLVETSYRD